MRIRLYTKSGEEKMSEKMFGLTDEENERYSELANLESRAVSAMVRESCGAECVQLQEKSRKAREAVQ